MTLRVVTDEQLGVLASRQNDLFRRVREGSLPIEAVLKGLQNLSEGNFDAVPTCGLWTIACDAVPFIPKDWQVEVHVKGGMLEFDPAKIALHLDEEQKDGKQIVGSELRKKLVGKAVMNANVLDALLANTALIPESWKQDENGRTRCVFFWGTIFRDLDDGLCVRCLCWDDGRWDWFGRWLGLEWDVQDPAALLAS